MGKRGPAPTPTKVLKLRGSWRANKRKNEPKPSGAKPRMPDWFDDETKRVWRDVVKLLDSMGILSRTDGKGITRYCVMYVQWRNAVQFIGKNGEAYVVRDLDGTVKSVRQYPQVTVAHKLAVNLLRLEQEFGLTPSARARIGVQDDKKTKEYDPKERFFRDQG